MRLNHPPSSRLISCISTSPAAFHINRYRSGKPGSANEYFQQDTAMFQDLWFFLKLLSCCRIRTINEIYFRSTPTAGAPDVRTRRFWSLSVLLRSLLIASSPDDRGSGRLDDQEEVCKFAQVQHRASCRCYTFVSDMIRVTASYIRIEVLAILHIVKIAEESVRRGWPTSNGFAAVVPADRTLHEPK